MTNCRLCNENLDSTIGIEIDVPAGTQLFSDQVEAALKLKSRIVILECDSCGLIQLAGDPIVYSNVSSSSSFVSAKLTEHRLGQLHRLLEMRPGSGQEPGLLEIGCGDGHLLEQSKGMFGPSVGIEPTQHNARIASERGLTVFQRLMDRDTVVAGGPFGYFCSFHVMEHVTAVCSVLQGIRSNLVPDAVGVIEVPSTEAALEHRRFGDFMPDHLNYFTENTLRMALQWSGFVVEDIYRDYGGEHLVAYVRRREIGARLSFVTDRQARLKRLVSAVNAQSLPFAIWGVSHHLMPYIGTLTGISGLIAMDGSSSKIGKFIPSTSVRVRDLSALNEIQHGYVAVTAPRFRDEIMGALGKKFAAVTADPQLSDWLGFDVMVCRDPHTSASSARAE